MGHCPLLTRGGRMAAQRSPPMRAPQVLELRFRPSLRLAVAIGAWYAATTALAWTLPVEPVIALLASGGLAVTAAVQILRTALRRGPRAWTGLRVGEDRAIEILHGGRPSTPGTVAATTYVGASLVALHVRAGDSPRLLCTVILGDMLPRDDFRRLRVLLRLSAGRGPPGRRSRARSPASSGSRAVPDRAGRGTPAPDAEQNPRPGGSGGAWASSSARGSPR